MKLTMKSFPLGDNRMSKSKWKFQADIVWIVNHKTMSPVEKAHRIRRALRSFQPFQKRAHREVLSNLIGSAHAGEAQFESSLEVLYTFCDHFGVWLAA